MLIDYHLHTSYSRDSSYPMEAVVKDAIELGVDEICFTDHVDYGTNFDWHQGQPIVIHPTLNYKQINVNYPKYYEEIQSLQEKYKDEIVLKFGLEFGIQQETINDFERLFAEYPLDFVVLSVHQVGNREFWNQDFQQNKTQEQYNLAYYQEILEVMKRFKNYSVLGHLDMIVRYDLQGKYPFEKTKPILTEILKLAIKDNKGIEINTSSHRYGLDDLTPSIDILKLYKQLGGTIVTIGSDSHRPGDVASKVNWSKQKLLELGFTHYCTFDKMQPIFHRLELD